MFAARRAVDLEALGAVFPAASACLLDGVGEEAEPRRLLATRLGGSVGGRSVQHALEDGRVAGSIRAEAKVAGEIDGADSPDRLDAMVTRSSGKRVAARSADAEHADAVLDRVAPGHALPGSAIQVPSLANGGLTRGASEVWAGNLGGAGEPERTVRSAVVRLAVVGGGVATVVVDEDVGGMMEGVGARCSGRASTGTDAWLYRLAAPLHEANRIPAAMMHRTLRWGRDRCPDRCPVPRRKGAVGGSTITARESTGDSDRSRYRAREDLPELYFGAAPPRCAAEIRDW